MVNLADGCSKKENRMQRLGWVLALVCLGCCGKTSTSTPDPVAPGPAVKPAEPVKPGPAVDDGTTVVEGALVVSKMMPFVQQWALPHEEMSERFGADWRTRVATRRLRVRGVTEIYVCPPESQCLTSGEIPRFKTVAELALICGNGETLVVPKRCPSPRCLKDCDRHVMTRHDACGKNAGPNRPTWCADSDDEMRQNCASGCATGCDPRHGVEVWCE
jgi:hypothetical protein